MNVLYTLCYMYYILFANSISILLTYMRSISLLVDVKKLLPETKFVYHFSNFLLFVFSCYK